MQQVGVPEEPETRHTGVRIGDEPEHATILKKDGVTTNVRTAAGQTGRKCKNPAREQKK
jgi:hypothetical protein